MTFDGGLRAFVDSFKLPGEAQKIDRIINCAPPPFEVLSRVFYFSFFLFVLFFFFSLFMHSLLLSVCCACVFLHPLCADPRLLPAAAPPPRRRAGFGRHFFRQCPQLFASDDAAYILAYAVIMLNTDLHNNQARYR